MDDFELVHWVDRQEGDLAVLIPGQAEGAIPNGTRVRKRNSLPGDGHVDGDWATVMASHNIEGRVLYFVTWDDNPSLPCAIAGHRIE